MREQDSVDLLIKVFSRLQHIGLGLGVSELLDSVRAVKGGWGRDSRNELRQVARLLWCNSIESMRDFDDAWAATVASEEPLPVPPKAQQLPPEITTEPIKSELPPSELPPSDPGVSEPIESELSLLPVQAPFMPVVLDESLRLDAYWPVTRRSMSYTWRYLRRMVPDGPEDVIDMQATVERAARQGFYLAPIFRRGLRNHARLLLLLDQGGSMVPFHRFTRDVSDTAERESSITDVEVYYFHNVVTDYLWRDSYLTEQIHVNVALSRCDGDTSVLIVSDAGSARGIRSLARIRATAQFLARLQQHTTLVAWLNPMPFSRWSDTSASAISSFVRMYQMDPDGFSTAIDVVRGQEV